MTEHAPGRGGRADEGQSDEFAVGAAIRRPFVWAGAVVSCLAGAAIVVGLLTHLDPRARGFWNILLSLPFMGLVAIWFVRLLWNGRGGRVVRVSFGPRVAVGGALLAFAIAVLFQDHPSVSDGFLAVFMAWQGLAMLARSRMVFPDSSAPPPSKPGP